MRPSLVVSGVVLLAGCAGAPAPETPPLLPAPLVVTRVVHSSGSPLCAGTTRVAPGSAEMALQATVTLFALDVLPETLLEPLATRTRLTLDEDDEQPLRAETSIAARARGGPVSDPRALAAALEAQRVRATRFANLRGALPDDVTARFEAVRDGKDSCAACEPVHERFAVLVHRSGAAIELGLELEDTHDATCAASPGKRVRPDRELVLLEPLAAGTFAIVAPSPFQGDEAKAILAVVEVEPAPDASCAAAHAEAFAVCAADLAREEELARMRETAPSATVAAPAPQLRRAESGTARSALLALAQEVQAPLAEDVALSGSDELVAATAARALDRGPWHVEQAALEALRAGATAAEPDAAALRFLERRGGEAARSVATFYSLAARARSLEDFERLLVSENEDLLEDASPAVRVRACEWLAARGRSPAGYDPLGPASERRAALERQEARRDDE